MTFAFRRMQAFSESAALACLVLVFLSFPVAMALGYVAMALVLLFGLLSGRIWQRWPTVRRAPVVWAALGLYALMLVGTLYTPASHDDVVLHLSKYSKLLWVPVGMALLSDQAWRRRCMNAFALAMLFILVSVYANIFWDLPWSSTHNQGWGQNHTVIGDYITQNVMMTFFVVLAMDRGLRAGAAVWQRGAWWLAAALGALSITHLSSGRTGYLLLLMALLAFFILATQGWKRWAALGLLGLGLLVVGATSVEVQQRVQLAVTEARNSDSMEITSIGGRINFWKNTWALVAQKPLTGWGTGSYHDAWCAQVTAEGWCAFGRWHPHNQYLFLWMENGLPGLLLFLALIGAPVWAARHAQPHQRRLLLSFAVIFAVNSLINASLWSSRESHFFVLLLILLCADALYTRRAAPQPATPQPAAPQPAAPDPLGVAAQSLR